jgi:hypothetical protein
MATTAELQPLRPKSGFADAPSARFGPPDLYKKPHILSVVPHSQILPSSTTLVLSLDMLACIWSSAVLSYGELQVRSTL